MKLLIDHNLSPALVRRLADLFPGSIHVWTIGLDTLPDASLWDYARDNDFALASKDSDFEDISLTRGMPPKWIWVRSGNGGTKAVEAAFRRHFVAIERFLADPNVSIYMLR
jgi:predicted nuclease of predicted toxin-antitoxin system